ncbi:D-alanine--D-alanine ligase family protein [Nanchangia anserum]|uniref:D-alanine--D-alanine ligase n=1 Tax=Nanchangia anserum TaxID=2692125 RepID=A0A8I0GF47_9ACTO|nr:D-alanine--D-alanine ligase family protein [Nanchangia anserum]MBD3688894.1 D-alanine--D-alanine ligase [Nanchangia anserum]
MSEHVTSSRPRVLVLFGGQSGEHGISCATAAGVLAAIDRDRYDVVPVGIARSGEWVLMPDDPQRYRLRGEHAYEVVADGPCVSIAPGGRVKVNDPADGSVSDLGRIDVAFPLLHGPFGEDGTIQGLLELAGVPYVGCGVLASAAGMDKHVTNALLTQAGLPAGDWELITTRDWMGDREAVCERIARLGSPVFVKPCRAGSSLGIARVSDPADLVPAIEAARAHDPRVVVEAELHGLEVECAVLGGGADAAPRCSSLGLIAVSDAAEFYDYETKYVDHDAVALTIPAPLPPRLAARARELAGQAFEALGCEGLARVDFFVDVDAELVTINEINTMPGFTPYSMYPALWDAEGVSYTDLVSELIELALTRPVGLR